MLQVRVRPGLPTEWYFERSSFTSTERRTPILGPALELSGRTMQDRGVRGDEQQPDRGSGLPGAGRPGGDLPAGGLPEGIRHRERDAADDHRARLPRLRKAELELLHPDRARHRLLRRRVDVSLGPDARSLARDRRRAS